MGSDFAVEAAVAVKLAVVVAVVVIDF